VAGLTVKGLGPETKPYSGFAIVHLVVGGSTALVLFLMALTFIPCGSPFVRDGCHKLGRAGEIFEG